MTFLPSHVRYFTSASACSTNAHFYGIVRSINYQNFGGTAATCLTVSSGGGNPPTIGSITVSTANAFFSLAMNPAASTNTATTVVAPTAGLIFHASYAGAPLVRQQPHAAEHNFFTCMKRQH